ncbi:MAG TPA: endo-1,4-beta-xylanase [Opitutaceae bacterium]
MNPIRFHRRRLRHFIFAGLFAASVVAPLRAVDKTASWPSAPASVSLKEVYGKYFLVGTALNARQYGDTEPAVTALVAREFNCATAENDMKWEVVEPKPNSFRFGPGDKFVDYCQRNGLTVIGHNLCWHSQLPSWVSKPEAGQATLTKEVLLARLKNHVQSVAAHYKGKVRGWDVVNEAINDGNGEYRNSVFYRVIGKEYLALAFKWAHEADPSAELYYNDYNLDADDAKRDRAVELVKYLREQGAHIDGIGLQGHYNLITPTAAKIDETITLFAKLGLKVMITELDVEAIRDAHVSGAVDAKTGKRALPKFFPEISVLKQKIGLTDTQAAQIEPLFAKAQEEIASAIAAKEFHRISEIREATGDAAEKHLDAKQRGAFEELLAGPIGGRPVGPPPPPLTPVQQHDLAQRYADIFKVFLKDRKVIERVTFWGVDDGESWRRQSSPLLFDDKLQRKPAYDAVIAVAADAGE